MANDILNNNWSPVDANNNVSPPNGFPEGQTAGSLNNASRMVMGAVRRETEKKNAWVATGGTGNTFTLTYDVAPEAYTAGEIIYFVADRANTGAATLNINALGARDLRSPSGAALGQNALQAGVTYGVAYVSGQFRLLSSPQPLQVTQVSAGGIIDVRIEGAGSTQQIIVSAGLPTYTVTNLGGSREVAISVSAQRDFRFRTIGGAGGIEVRTSANEIVVSARHITNNNQLTNGAGFITQTSATAEFKNINDINFTALNVNGQTASGTFKVSAGADSYTLPTSAGTTGQVLISNGNATTASFQDISTNQVLAATAGATAGAVGTYMYGNRTNNPSTNINFGTIIAGNSLRPAGIVNNMGYDGDNQGSRNGVGVSTIVPSGTWRCMGYSRRTNDTGTLNDSSTLWLRIS